DSLTGLANRVLFTNRVEHALEQRERKDGDAMVAVLFIDLDDFKTVNDSMGHAAGDSLLVEVARRIDSCIRVEDTGARLGGDEFAVLLDDADDVGEAERVAQRILNGLEAPFAIENREINVAASIGIAFRGQDDNEPGDLLRKADLALYQVKYKDKAGYRVFEETMSTSVSERLELEAELRRAIELDEFEVFYQPIIQVSSGQAVAFEALLRWRHPERGLLQPLEFISVAEEVGLMVPVGYQVIRHACTQASLWNKRYPSRRSCVFVNLSARQLAHPRLVEDVSRIVLETGLPAGALCLEATENVLMDDTLATRQTLNKLKELDVELALDDFGTGHSSLAYLKNFPIDTVKIDQSFVGGLGQDPTDKVLISAIIELVHALDMKVVAEGVETGDQLSHLVEIGCDLVQGNYLSEPLPAEGLTPLLASGSWRVT
ncbi:MAG: putative bifunctional diguanylate cyclase/phosphodiesterase, partial [Rubrobacteraceae bacterium]